MQMSLACLRVLVRALSYHLDAGMEETSRSFEVVGECTFETIAASRLSVRQERSCRKVAAATNKTNEWEGERKRVGLCVLC